MSRVVIARTVDGQLPFFPSGVRLADGRVLVVYREGLAHVRSVGRILAVESADDGLTWSEPRVIVDTVYDDRDPMLVQLSSGDLLLNWFQINWAVQPWECPAVLVTRSTDGGASWEKPVAVQSEMQQETDQRWRRYRAGHIATHGQILELPDGDLLVPVYGVFPGDHDHSASVVRSTDGGLTWPAENEVVLGRKPGRGYVEPVLTLLPGGQVTALLRTDEEAELARSDDNGLTWTEPELCGLYASSADTITLSDGSVLLAYGDVSKRFGPGRPTVATLIRDPLGRWDKDPVRVVIDAGRDTADQANPAVVELPGDRFLVASYDIFRREVVGEIIDRADLT